MPRCKNGTRRNKKTGNCDPISATKSREHVSPPTRKIKNENHVTIDILYDEYKVIPSVNKWVQSLRKSNKILKNAEKFKDDEGVKLLMEGFDADFKEGITDDFKEYIIHEVMESADQHIKDDYRSNPNQVIQLKHIRLVINMTDELQLVINGK